MCLKVWTKQKNNIQKPNYVIIVECIDGFYGEECNFQCGHCGQKEICDNRNGSCYHGCEPNFDGARCDSKCRWKTQTWTTH